MYIYICEFYILCQHGEAFVSCVTCLPLYQSSLRKAVCCGYCLSGCDVMLCLVNRLQISCDVGCDQIRHFLPCVKLCLPRCRKHIRLLSLHACMTSCLLFVFLTWPVLLLGGSTSLCAIFVGMVLAMFAVQVLAGFTMTCNPELVPWEEPAQVISLATGTKCISSGYLSSEGKSLNDCHAEVISRRSLLRFLYAELRKHLSSDAAIRLSSVFIPRDDGCGFRLRDGVRFHLYVSTAPCGDARLFSATEPTVSSADKHPNRQSRGQLRTKMESGDGTNLSKSADTVQTWDRVVAGERLLSMSCSDKLLRWNVLGLQGWNRRSLYQLLAVCHFVLSVDLCGEARVPILTCRMLQHSLSTGQ